MFSKIMYHALAILLIASSVSVQAAPNILSYVNKLITNSYISDTEKKELTDPAVIIPVTDQILSEHLDNFFGSQCSCCPPTSAQIVIDLILHPSITAALIRNCAKKSIGTNKLVQLEQDSSETTLLDILAHGLPKNKYEFFRLALAFKREKTITPTEAHWIKNLKIVTKSFNLKKFMPLLRQVVAQEKLIVAKGNLPFVHAANQRIIFLQDLYTQGWNILHSQTPGNYLFLRADSCTSPAMKSFFKRSIYQVLHHKVMQKKEGMNIYNTYKDRPTQQLIKKITEKLKDPHKATFNKLAQGSAKQTNEKCGCCTYEWTGKKLYACSSCEKKGKLLKSAFYKMINQSPVDVTHAQEILEQEVAPTQDCLDIANEKIRKRIIFMNAAFFSNTSSFGSSTANYFWNNSNCSSCDHITTTTISQKLGMERYFTKYQKDIDELEKLHSKAAGSKGILLQFDFTPEATKQSVYVGKGYGYTAQLEIINGTSIDDVEKISTIMRTDINQLCNSDKFEFSFIATNLAPNKGVNIYRHYYGNQELVQEYYKKRDALFAKIRADYNERRAAA